MSYPVTPDGGTLHLYRGDDYRAADGRGISIPFLSLNFPSLDGASVSCVFTGIDGNPITIPAVVSGNNVLFDLTHDQTAAMLTGEESYVYTVRATLADGDIVTLTTGNVTVV